jgi:hypothetical protein
VRILQGTRGARRFDFDTELAVRLFWAGVPPINLSTPVRYFKPAEGGRSHFHYLRDNWLLIRRHTLLVLADASANAESLEITAKRRGRGGKIPDQSSCRRKKTALALMRRRLAARFFTRRRLAVVLILAVGLTTPVVLALNWDHKLVFFSLELVTKFLIFYPAIRANCRWFGPVVAHFRTQQKAVWLTFDDGPHAEDTPKLLASC